MLYVVFSSVPLHTVKLRVIIITFVELRRLCFYLLSVCLSVTIRIQEFLKDIYLLYCDSCRQSRLKREILGRGLNSLSAFLLLLLLLLVIYSRI